MYLVWDSCKRKPRSRRKSEVTCKLSSALIFFAYLLLLRVVLAADPNLSIPAVRSCSRQPENARSLGLSSHLGGSVVCAELTKYHVTTCTTRALLLVVSAVVYRYSLIFARQQRRLSTMI